MEKKKVVSLEDRIPKLKKKKQQRTNVKFIAYISIFFILLLVIVYFQSSLSKVATIEVNGNRAVSDEVIVQLSGLSSKTTIWGIRSKLIEAQIEKHKEISEAKISKSFPNKVVIHIKELSRIAYMEMEGKFYPVLETGRVLEPLKLRDVPADAPILIDWKQGEKLQELAAELRKVPDSIMNRISEVHHRPTLSDTLHISILMNDGYEVQATIRGLSKKLTAYPAIVQQLPENAKGIIHMEVGSYFESYQTKGDGEIESKE